MHWDMVIHGDEREWKPSNDSAFRSAGKLGFRVAETPLEVGWSLPRACISLDAPTASEAPARRRNSRSEVLGVLEAHGGACSAWSPTSVLASPISPGRSVVGSCASVYGGASVPLRCLLARAAGIEVASSALADSAARLAARRRAAAALLLRRRGQRQLAASAASAFDAWRCAVARTVQLKAEVSSFRIEAKARGLADLGTPVAISGPKASFRVERLSEGRDRIVARKRYREVWNVWKMCTAHLPHRRRVAASVWWSMASQPADFVKVAFGAWWAVTYATSARAGATVGRGARCDGDVATAAVAQVEQARARLAEVRKGSNELRSCIRSVREACQSCVKRSRAALMVSGNAVASSAMDEFAAGSHSSMAALAGKRNAVLAELHRAVGAHADAVSAADDTGGAGLPETSATGCAALGANVAQLVGRLSEVRLQEAAVADNGEVEALGCAVAAAQCVVRRLAASEARGHAAVVAEARRLERERGKLTHELEEIRAKGASDVDCVRRTANAELAAERESQERLCRCLEETRKQVDYLDDQHRQLMQERKCAAARRAELGAVGRQVTRLAKDREQRLAALRRGGGLAMTSPAAPPSPSASLKGTSALHGFVEVVDGASAEKRDDPAPLVGHSKWDWNVAAMEESFNSGAGYPRSASVSPEAPWCLRGADGLTPPAGS